MSATNNTQASARHLRGEKEHIYEKDGRLEQPLAITSAKYFTSLVMVGTMLEEVCDTPDIVERTKKLKVYNQLMSAKRQMENVIHSVCTTIPDRQYRMIKQDIRLSTIYMKHTGASEALDKDKYLLGDLQSMRVLAEAWKTSNCALCDKCGKEAKKCAFRKAYESVFIAPCASAFTDKEGLCPLSGGLMVEEKIE